MSRLPLSTVPFCWVIAGILFLAPTRVLASPFVTFEAPPDVASGETFAVRVLLSSDTALNAIEAQLSYPTSLLELISFDRSGSLFDFWRAEPDVSVSGTLSFEAAARSAFSGEAGEVLALEFRALGSGTASLTFEDLALYAADGKATRLTAGLRPTTITIHDCATINLKPDVCVENVKHPMSNMSDQTVKHRMFNISGMQGLAFSVVEVVESPVDGATLLVFEVRGEGSGGGSGGGIASIEARERGLWPLWGPWRRVTTPLALEDSVRTVELRAFDRAGREVRERISVRDEVSPVVVVAVVFGALIVGVAWLWIMRRRTRQHVVQ